MVKANHVLSNSALFFISLTANCLLPCLVPETLHARFLVSVKPLMALAFRLTPKHLYYTQLLHVVLRERLTP